MNKALSYRDFPAFSPEKFDKSLEELDLLARHDLYFETCRAATQEQIDAAYALRYQVYCLERGFENPEEHAGGLEHDAFDQFSIHGLLYHRPSGEAMGTVRMVLPDAARGENSLPVIRLLAEQNINLEEHIPTARAIEVSRFAISKNFRRRATDNDSPMGITRVPLERIKRGNIPCLSLIQFLLRQSVEHGITYWAAVMEVKLLRMLASMGIRFTAVGPLVDHHGLRQPCYIYVPKMLEDVLQEQKDYWDVITNGGQLHEELKRIVGPV